MPNRFWVGGCPRKDWESQQLESTNWATTSGGPGNARTPTSLDDVFFDGNSGRGEATISQHITIGSLDCTGYLGTLHQAANVRLRILRNSRLNDPGSMVYLKDDRAAIVDYDDATVTFDARGQTINRDN